MSITEVRNEVRIPVRAQNGATLESEIQIVYNTVMPTVPELAPHLVRLDAESREAGHDVFMSKFWIRKFALRNDKDEARQYMERDIAPVSFGSRTFKPVFWGSAVKSGSVYYYDVDLPIETGFIKYSEQAGRLGRAWLPRGDNGAQTGDFRVLIVKPGTEINGWRVEDGFGYYAKELYQRVQYGREAYLGHVANMTASFFLECDWQATRQVPILPERTKADIIRHIEHVCGQTPKSCGYDDETMAPTIKEADDQAIVWYTAAVAEYAESIDNYIISWRHEISTESKLYREFEPDIKASLEFVNAPKWNDLVTSGGSKASHNALVAADPDLAFHPWISAMVSKRAAGLRSRVGQAPQLRAFVYVAVPALGKAHAIWPASYLTGEGGESVSDSTAICYGQPISNVGAIRAYDDVQQYGPEADRIAELEVVQYSMTATNLDVSFKGQCGLIPAADMIVNGQPYDVILCTEDAKVGRVFEATTKMQYQKEWSGVINMTAVFMRHWAAGSAFGIDAHDWKISGKDHDGDQIYAISASRYPELTRQVREWAKREVVKIKIPKTYTPIKEGQDMRPYQASASMANLIGNITNLRQVVYSMTYDSIVGLAELLGYKTVGGLMEHIELIHQVAEDIFKTTWRNTDKPGVRPTTAMILNQISWISSAIKLAKERFGAAANYTTWKRDQFAFTSRIPRVGILADMKDEWERRCGIDYTAGGFMAPYQRMVLPQIVMNAAVEVRPLSHFESYAYPAPTPEANKDVRFFNTAYKAAIERSNQMDPDDWNTFIGDWTAKLDRLVVDMQARYGANITRYDVCCWLWYASHHEQKTGGNIVMALALPEALRIVKEKPGRVRTAHKIDAPVAEINVISPQYQFEVVVGALSFDCSIVEFQAPAKGNQLVTRRAIVNTGALLAGQKQPGDGYPRNMVALIDRQNEGKVQPGNYRCTIAPAGKTWIAKLFAVQAG